MKVFAAALVFGLTGWSTAIADQLPAPEGDIILTVSGNITNEVSDGTVTLDMDTLKSLPMREFKTSTIWLDGETTFTGVPLMALLDHVGATGGNLEAIALNDYKITIPVETIEEDAPIVAYLIDGEAMSPRGKGPLWIVYPYDKDAKYRTEVIYSRSIWQLDRISLVE